MFLHCPKCLPEASAAHQPPREYARLSVEATEKGDLVISCVRHNKTVLVIENLDLATKVREYGNRPCANEGIKH